MALENLSFEDVQTTTEMIEGVPTEVPHPGVARGWTMTVVSRTTIAGYDLGFDERAWEPFFEGWVDGYQFAIEPSDMAAAEYADAVPGLTVLPTVETFSLGWPTSDEGATPFLTELGAMTAAPYDGTGIVEDFSAWTDPFEDELAASVTSAGADGFLSGWVTPHTTIGSMEVPDYGVIGGTWYAEEFESAIAPVPFVPNPGVNAALASPSHGLADGKRVLVRSSGRLPDGFGLANYYFVVNATTHTFELAGISGGTGIVAANAGSGTHFVVTDGVSEWDLVTTV